MLAPASLCNPLGFRGHLCLCNQTDFTRNWTISSRSTQPTSLKLEIPLFKTQKKLSRKYPFPNKIITKVSH